MKKQLLAFNLIILSLLLFGFQSNAQTIGGGDGSIGNPYQIKTKAHMAQLAQLVTTNNGGSLTADTTGRRVNILNL